MMTTDTKAKPVSKDMMLAEAQSHIERLQLEAVTAFEKIKNANEWKDHYKQKAEEAEARLVNMKHEMAALRSQHDTLQGYVDRIHEQEQPPERRQAERRQRERHENRLDPFAGHPAFSNKRDRKKEWFE